MDDSPSFSVVIPTYNRGAFILDAIQSVLQQDYRAYEAIIVDDGSQDNTQELVSEVNSPKVKYIYQTNSERAVARNRGVLEAKNDYVTFLDSDDVLYSNYLQEAAKVITRYEMPPFVHLRYEIKNKKGHVFSRMDKRKGSLNQKLIEGNSLSCLGIFIRNDIAKLHPFNEDRRIIGSEDYELWMRLASLYPIVYSNEVVAALTQHEDRSVLNVVPEQLINRIELTIDYLIENEGFRVRFGKYQRKFVAHRYLYLSLHLVMSQHKKLGVSYWFKALVNRPQILFHRKTIGILKNLLRHS